MFFRGFQASHPLPVRVVVRGAVLAVVLWLASGCDRPRAGRGEAAVAARVGDGVILVKDVEEEIARRVKNGNLVPAKETLLNTMVERRLLIDKAKRAGLDKDPDLQKSWENLLISRYKELNLRQGERAATVSDEEIAQRYEANPDRFTRPGKARLAILTVALPATLTQEERTEKLAALSEVRSMAPQSPVDRGFGALAVDHSEDDVTRHRGGDAGWLDAGVAYRWPAPVVEAGFALKPGEVSEPIEADGAAYLVRKTDERAAVRLPLERVRDQLRRELQAEKRRAVEEAFASQLRQDVTIETFPGTLKDLKVPVPDAKSIAAEEVPPGIP